MQTESNDPRIIARETMKESILARDKETEEIHQCFIIGTRVSYSSVEGSPNPHQGEIIDISSENLVRVDWDDEPEPSWIDARLLKKEVK